MGFDFLLYTSWDCDLIGLLEPPLLLQQTRCQRVQVHLARRSPQKGLLCLLSLAEPLELGAQHPIPSLEESIWVSLRACQEAP